MIVSLQSTPLFFFFFNDTATTEIYTLSLHDALPISLFGQLLQATLQQPVAVGALARHQRCPRPAQAGVGRSNALQRATKTAGRAGVMALPSDSGGAERLPSSASVRNHGENRQVPRRGSTVTGGTDLSCAWPGRRPRPRRCWPAAPTARAARCCPGPGSARGSARATRSEEHTSELQS